MADARHHLNLGPVLGARLCSSPANRHKHIGSRQAQPAETQNAHGPHPTQYRPKATKPVEATEMPTPRTTHYARQSVRVQCIQSAQRTIGRIAMPRWRLVGVNFLSVY